jgi:hypothetical protein
MNVIMIRISTYPPNLKFKMLLSQFGIQKMPVTRLKNINQTDKQGHIKPGITVFTDCVKKILCSGIIVKYFMVFVGRVESDAVPSPSNQFSLDFMTTSDCLNVMCLSPQCNVFFASMQCVYFTSYIFQ